ncbi:Plasmodium variant antigen protein Cir/Yir/Bir, putative [Plasmodium chabaudi adami]|uniref:Plasmodium variant antigen protein Cir/Yir/Bir, putative n=1 Tax=Plasmodium chabaudi adami TaxID=5826 RepID=A0A1D3LD09_PLACE|nr:Plasmodium variant antigen protein Cir/Yir/Bir, putative [Plasmodium chabaudi adami]
MDNVCKIIDPIWKDIPDTLDTDGNYNFDRDHICKTYCGKNCNNYCENDTDKIMTGFVSLFMKLYESQLIKDSAPNSMNIVEYLIIWLIHMLKLKDDNTISNLSETFKSYIDERGGHILASTDPDYSIIIEKCIVNKNYLVNMDKNIISKFYNLLKSLCQMYTECNNHSTDGTTFLEKANGFVENYKKLNDDSSVTGNSSYKKILSNLFNDYNGFKNECPKKCSGCTNIPTLPEIKTPQISVETSTPSHVQDNTHSSLQGSEVTSSSSSVASKLIPVLSIFAIPLFLGIAYKYSLFGFGKRVHRKDLREKVKKIKKKMNHHI